MHTLLLDDPELLRGLDELIRKGLYGANYALRAARPARRGVRGDGRRRFPQPHRRHRPCHRPPARRVHKRRTTCRASRARSASPSRGALRTRRLQSQGVMAIVTTGGSALSHSAILARSLHLPLVVGRGACAAAGERRRRADRRRQQRPAGGRTRRRRPARLPHARARRTARTQATAPPAARTLAHRRWRRHPHLRQCRIARGRRRGDRSAPPASACTAPSSCSWATCCRTRTRSSAPTATSPSA